MSRDEFLSGNDGNGTFEEPQVVPNPDPVPPPTPLPAPAKTAFHTRPLWIGIMAFAGTVIVMTVLATRMFSPVSDTETILASYKNERVAADSVFQDLDFKLAEYHRRRALELTTADGGRRPTMLWVNTASALIELAQALSAQGRSDEAMEYVKEALHVSEAAYGPNSVEVLCVLGPLVVLYQSLDLDSLAGAVAVRADSITTLVQPIYMRALAAAEPAAAKDPRLLTKRLLDLGDLYMAQGRADQAEPLFARALILRQNMVGSGNAVTDQIRYRLADACDALHKRSRAREIYRDLLAKQESERGRESPRLVGILERIGEIEMDRGGFVDAESLYTRAIRIRERVLGREHPTLVGDLSARSEARLTLRRFKGALRDERRAHEIDRRVFGSEHSRMGRHLMAIAEIEAAAGKKKAAAASAEEALSILAKALGGDHALTEECRALVDELSSEVGRTPGSRDDLLPPENPAGPPDPSSDEQDDFDRSA